MLTMIADEVGAELEMVDMLTAETHIFVKGLGGAAAILRYPLPVEFVIGQDGDEALQETFEEEDDGVDSDLEFIF
jgi:hypothetical protein